MALNTNLVAYYKMDESSGNPQDSVGSNHGTNNSCTYGAAKINNGMTTNGSTQYVSLPTTIGTIQTNWTVSLWIKPTNDAGYFIGARGNSEENFSMSIDTSLTRLHGTMGNSVSWLDSSLDFSHNFTAGEWYHLVFAVNATSCVAYVNASAKTAETWSSGTPRLCGDVANLGLFAYTGDNADTLNNLACSMDEVAIWSRTLTSDEVTTLYNGGSGLQYPFSTGNPGAFFQMF